MSVRYLNPETLSVPPGYTHVVEVRGGRTVYISGQVPLDKAGNLVGVGDFAAQTTQVFENLRLALASVGATFDRFVKPSIDFLRENLGLADRQLVAFAPHGLDENGQLQLTAPHHTIGFGATRFFHFHSTS